MRGLVGVFSGDYALTVIAGFFVIVMATVARDEYRHAAKARDIAHDIAGPAQHRDFAFDAQHGDRRFGRNAVGRTVDETVEHHVAHANDARALQLGHKGGEIGVRGHDECD